MKTAVVTGANIGIGLETTRGLAAKGFRTVLVCRSRERAEAAAADIRSTLSDADVPIVLCDLGLLADVRRAAADLAAFAPIDVLVNNAGITIRRRTETAEGVDTMLAVNHLGPFLLTNLLLPHMAEGGRIVTVASEAHALGTLRLDDIQATRGYGPLGFARYGETKLMNILFTRELARRLKTDGSTVTANAVHPGGVRTNLGAPPKAIAALIGLVLLSAEEGARTSLAVATDPAFATTTGAYFVKSKPADNKLRAKAKDYTAAAALWDASAALVGL